MEIFEKEVKTIKGKESKKKWVTGNNDGTPAELQTHNGNRLI